MTLRYALPAAFCLVAALPAAAQDPATDPQCATVRVAMPAGFSGWSMRAPLASGRAPRSAPVLVVGRGADLSLHPVVQVRALLPWGKAPAAETQGGLAMFQVARAGTYRVGLGSAAWIDVVHAGRTVPSSAHGHGPMCTGIRKIVDFKLKPGRYVLQISGSAAPNVAVLIARGEA